MRRLPNRTTGLSVEEEGNVVVVKTESWRAPADLVIQVPFNTSLELGCVNDGDIVVDQARGEVEAQNVNGSITLTKIGGSALANTTNEVVVSFARLSPGRRVVPDPERQRGRDPSSRDQGQRDPENRQRQRRLQRPNHDAEGFAARAEPAERGKEGASSSRWTGRSTERSTAAGRT
jgi:hypothetical protein